MEATSGELKASRLFAMLDEVKHGKTVKPNHSGWCGYDKRVYNKHLSKDRVDALAQELCSLLKERDAKQYSLEVQTWWRDHQAADAKREKKERQQAALKIARENPF